MKITQNTPDSLVINCREGQLIWFLAPIWFALLWALLALPGEDAPVMIMLIVGLFAFIIGLLVVLDVRRTQLVLDARTGRAELRRKTMFGYVSRWFDLAHIETFHVSAKFDVQSRPRPDARQGYLNLYVTGGMDQGDFSVNTYLRKFGEAQHCADTATSWLKATRATAQRTLPA